LGRSLRGLPVERAQLIGEVLAQPSAVLTLEGTQALDLGAEARPLPVELTGQLLAAARRLGLQLLGLRLGVLGQLVGAGPSIGQQRLCFCLRLGYQLIGVARGQLEQASGARRCSCPSRQLE